MRRYCDNEFGVTIAGGRDLSDTRWSWQGAFSPSVHLALMFLNTCTGGAVWQINRMVTWIGKGIGAEWDGGSGFGRRCAFYCVFTLLHCLPDKRPEGSMGSRGRSKFSPATTRWVTREKHQHIHAQPPCTHMRAVSSIKHVLHLRAQMLQAQFAACLSSTCERSKAHCSQKNWNRNLLKQVLTPGHHYRYL